jgi:hypothetical protein
MIADQFLVIVRHRPKRNRHGLRARIDATFRGHRIKITDKRVVLQAALQREKGLPIMKANIDQPMAPE